MEDKAKEILRLNQLSHNENGEVLIVHRTDDKKKIHYFAPVTLEGTITAPGNYIEKRPKQFNHKRMHVVYNMNMDELSIILTTKENYPTLQYAIKGSLMKNPEIAGLGVNTKKHTTVKELAQLLRFNSFLFADKDQNLSLVSNLQKFRVAAQTFIEKEDVQRGNEKDYFEIKGAETNIDLTFDLNMPIFVGQAKKKFKVEIMYRIRERNVEVWLESPELAELYRFEAESIMAAQLKRFPEDILQIEQQ